MPNELSVVEVTELSVEDRNQLDSTIDQMIAAHKNNRTEINRLVFDSVAAMTEADEAQSTLSNKGFFSRLWGGITGSNQELQNKINENRAIAQYASQQTLQKLAEQNLMSFDLITAVNNKLNASINATNEEFKNIYSGLSKFLRHNRNELARIEARLDKVEQNVNLLTWQNSIEYQEFDGEEYIDMSDAKKIVCLVRDFYDITKGNWSTSDLLLLKTAMSTIDIQPKDKVNYFSVIKEIASNEVLKNKLLGGAVIDKIEEPSYLVTMGAMGKLDNLRGNEQYIVNTIDDYLAQSGISVEKSTLEADITKKYIREFAEVDMDIEVDSYDLMIDFLFNLKEAAEEKLLIAPVTAEDNEFDLGMKAFYRNDLEVAVPIFTKLADNGNTRAMYILGEIYTWVKNPTTKDKKIAREWRHKGASNGDVLCIIQKIFENISEAEKAEIVKKYIPKLHEMADSGDVFAMTELGYLYREGIGVAKNDDLAIHLYKKCMEKGYTKAAVNLGYLYACKGVDTREEGIALLNEAHNKHDFAELSAMYYLGTFYYNEKDYDNAIECYKKSSELKYGPGQELNDIGNLYWRKDDYLSANEWYQKGADIDIDWSCFNLAGSYRDGKGVEKNIEKAISLYKKAYDLDDAAAGQSANQIANILYGREDYTGASQWYKKAGEKNYDWGYYNLGNCFYNGNGVEQDYSMAIKYFTFAYNLDGDAAGDAANRIGNILYNRNEYAESNEWYEKSSGKNFAWGYNNLASSYVDGKGVEVDTHKAIELYKKAVELGGDAGEHAKKKIDELTW